MDYGIELPHFRKNNDDILKIVREYDTYEPLNYLRAVSAASLSHKNANSKKKEFSSMI